MVSKLKSIFFKLLAEQNSFFSIVRKEDVLGVSFGEKCLKGKVWIDADFSKVLGYDDEQNLHWSIFLSNAVENLLTVRDEEEKLLVLKRKDGNTISFSCIAHPVKVEGKDYLLCTYQNYKTETEELLHEYKHVNQIFDEVDLYLIKISLEGFYTYVNDFFCKRLGAKREDVIGQHSLMHIIPEDHRKFQQVVGQCFKEPNATIKVTLRKPDIIPNTFITNEWEFTLLTNQEGLPEEIFCIGHDISLEASQRKELQQLSLITQNAKNGILITNKEFTVDWHNPSFNAISGFTPKEVKERNFITDFFGVSLKTLITDYEGAKVLKCVGKNNLPIWLSIDVFPFFNTATEQKSYIFICVDVSEVSRKNQELLKVNQQMELAIKTAKLGIWSLNLTTNYLDWNDQLHAIYGITKEEFRNRPDDWRNQIVEEDAELANTEFAKIFNGEEVNNVHFRIKDAKTAELKHLLASGIPIKNEQGEIEKLIGINIDISEIVQSQEAEREAKDQLERMTNSVPGAVLRYKLNTDGTDELIYLSKGAESVWEIPLEKIENINALWNPVFEEDISGMQNSIMESAQDLTTWNHEWRIHLSNNRMKWLNGIGTPKRNKDGSTLWDTLILDITERKNIETALQISEEQLKLSIEGADLGLWDLYVDTGDCKFNEKWAELVGYTLKELEPHNFDTWAKLCHPDDLEKANQMMQNYFEGKTQNYEVEVRMKHKAGHWIWVVTKGKIVERDKDGNPLRLSGTHFEISKRVHAQKQAEKLAHVSENTTNLLLTCDEFGRITWANEIHKEVMGLSPQEIIGLKITEKLKSTEEGSKKIVSLEKALEDHQAFYDIIPLLVHNTDKLLWISYNVTPIYNEQGEFLYSIVNKKDVTDLLEKQKELEALLDTTTKQNDRLKEYSYIVSHNIRSSVARIKGISHLLKSEPTNQELLEGMSVAADTLDVTIRNINDLLQIEKELASEKEIDYDLGEALKRVLELNQHIIDKKEAVLSINMPASGIALKTIPAYFDSILQNLLTNALKYGVTPFSKKLEMTFIDKPDAVIIKMKDYGIGINLEKNRDKMFKLGSRLHTVSKGHGMGLFMTQRQVESLGGTIEVESAEYKGTTFTVTLYK